MRRCWTSMNISADTINQINDLPLIFTFSLPKMGCKNIYLTSEYRSSKRAMAVVSLSPTLEICWHLLCQLWAVSAHAQSQQCLSLPRGSRWPPFSQSADLCCLIGLGAKDTLSACLPGNPWNPANRCMLFYVQRHAYGCTGLTTWQSTETCEESVST